jgi:hypothetical protein
MPASDPPPVEPLRCLSCWYVVNEAPDAGPLPPNIPCPECGTPLTDLSRRLASVRAAMIRESVKPAVRGFAIMGAGVVVYAALAVLFNQRTWVVASIIAIGIVGLAAMAGLTPLVISWRGSARRAANPTIERLLVAYLWLRHLPLLASPWLIPMPAGLVLLVTMLFSPLVFPDRETSEMVDFAVGLILIPASCAAVIVAMLEWSDRWNKAIDHANLRSTDVPLRGVLVAIVVNVVSIFLGILAAIVVVAFAFHAKALVHGR